MRRKITQAYLPTQLSSRILNELAFTILVEENFMNDSTNDCTINSGRSNFAGKRSHEALLFNSVTTIFPRKRQSPVQDQQSLSHPDNEISVPYCY